MPRTLTSRDIHALVHLLGDDDPDVKEHAREALRQAGRAATPHLAIAAATSGEQAIRVESSVVLEDIHVDEIERGWVALQAADEDVALVEGALLLERMIHPGRRGRHEATRIELDLLVAGARRAVPPGGTAFERVERLRAHLHDELGFRGNVERYYDPENSFFSSVVLERTGIPITLALVYLAVGRRIGLPIDGIGMPMHFLVGVTDGLDTRYLDPFFGGREVTRGECLLLLERAGFEPPEGYLRPTPVVGVLQRMARNLALIYQNAASERPLRLARRFITVLTGEVV